MKGNMPYDCAGFDGQDNIRAWKLLPPSVQFFIRTLQNRIEEEVQAKNVGMFRASSGFRSEETNRRHNGKINSGHRLGYCRDYVCISPDYGLPPVVDNTRFRVIRSEPEKCWHVEVIV